MDEINQTIAALMDRAPGDPDVRARVGQWFRLINDRFYPCPPEALRGLGDLYVDDPRFTALYAAVRPGLAQFLREAMRIFGERLAPG